MNQQEEQLMFFFRQHKDSRATVTEPRTPSRPDQPQAARPTAQKPAAQAPAPVTQPASAPTIPPATNHEEPLALRASTPTPSSEDLVASPPLIPPESLACRQTAPSAAVPEDLVAESLLVLLKTTDRIEAKLVSTLADNQATTKDMQATMKGMAQNIRSLEDARFREDVLQPLLLALLATADELLALKQRLQETPDTAMNDVIQSLDGIEAGILSTLGLHGVTRMPSVLSVPFDPRRQKIARINKSICPKTGEVVQVNLPGYDLNGRVLRPQEVTVLDLR